MDVTKGCTEVFIQIGLKTKEEDLGFQVCVIFNQSRFANLCMIIFVAAK